MLDNFFQEFLALLISKRFTRTSNSNSPRKGGSFCSISEQPEQYRRSTVALLFNNPIFQLENVLLNPKAAVTRRRAPALMPLMITGRASALSKHCYSHVAQSLVWRTCTIWASTTGRRGRARRQPSCRWVLTDDRRGRQ